MQFTPFNSRDVKHKEPFGAVRTGSTVRFTVTMPRDMRVSAVRLIVNSQSGDSRGDFYWDGTDGVTENWTLHYTAGAPDICFYHFEYATPWGVGKIFLDSSGVGCFSDSGKLWQLTVYDRDGCGCSTAGGIIYQIFPDRFYYSGTAKRNVPGDRILRDDWGAQPEWRPDEDGVVRNRDYFRGDLRGIEEKLPYIASLGVTEIYLNPIFESHSNHRYDTADYMRIDPLLGDTLDFVSLCEKARSFGIGIILDGVFNHTGADSRYFDLYGRYGGGAFDDENSPYRSWYDIAPDGTYASWWGFPNLPEVREDDPGYIDFITGKNGVIRHWMELGADGWRLDVADELPDSFIEKIRAAVKAQSPDAPLYGEVWEDASNKTAYNVLRRYLLGKELDGVTNYPFRTAVIDFCTGGAAEVFMERIVSICENYPPDSLNCLMNVLSTHDTARILTALAGIKTEGMSRERQEQLRLTGEQLADALTRLRAAAALMYALPGVPTVYYGDEAGMQGGSDPFSRGCFPWGNENTELTDYYRLLGGIRRRLPQAAKGRFVPVSAMLGCVCFAREADGAALVTVCNMNPHPIDYTLPEKYRRAVSALGCAVYDGVMRLDALTTGWAEVRFD
ncbi:MAG: glycoside hydrolase family 13 protein [Clostridiales bacterium]|nr:glycoside hydrolase family 13 protein [Clostridiales bacterium]